MSKLHFDPEGGTFSNFSVSYKPSYLTVSFGKVIKRLMIALWSADICIMVVLVTCYTAICQADTVLTNLLNFKLKVMYYWLVLKFRKICQFVQVYIIEFSCWIFSQCMTTLYRAYSYWIGCGPNICGIPIHLLYSTLLPHLLYIGVMLGWGGGCF